MALDWANLPNHLLDSVLERLVTASDYLQFSIVCMRWNRAAKDNKSQRRVDQLPTTAPPQLLICNKKEGTWNLYDIMNKKIVDWELRLPNKQMCGSSKGWLIVVHENFVVSLINPFFRVKGRKEKDISIIDLPPLENKFRSKRERKFWSKRSNCFVFRATITHDPILNANDCIIIIVYEDLCKLAFFRFGKDTKWNYVDESVDDKWRPIDDVVEVEGKFYVVNGLSKTFSFNITNQSISEVEVISDNILGETWKKYLVDSNEKELLMVHRYISFEGQDRKRVTKKFIVYKFNFEICEWVEKNTLGDVAVFVGDNSSISVVASNFPGCQSNCIYFTQDNIRIGSTFGKHGLRDFGVYNMENQSISQACFSDAKKLMKKTTRPPIWVLPTLRL